MFNVFIYNCYQNLINPGYRSNSEQARCTRYTHLCVAGNFLCPCLCLDVQGVCFMMSPQKTRIPFDQYTSSRLAYLLLGISLGLSTHLIALLTQTNIIINGLEVPRWTSEFAPCFLIIGGFSAGMLMQRYGRVPVIEWATLILGLGWTVVCLSNVVFESFSIGSSLVTYAIGMMAPTLSVYAVETNPLEADWRFGAGTITTLGIMMSFLLPHIVCLRTLVVFLQIITILLYYLLQRNVPDSPIWLMSKKYLKEASSSFKWFGFGLADNSADAEVLGSRSAALCKDREKVRMPPSKMFVCIFFQQITNNHLTYYYIVKTGFPIDMMATMAHVLFGVFPSLTINKILDKRTRLRASLPSTIVVCVIYLMASAHEYVSLEGDKSRVSNYCYLFLFTCNVINCGFGYAFGLYSLPWIITVENTPSDRRGILTSCLWVVNYLVWRFWLHLYEWILPFIEIYGITNIFLMMAVLTVLFHLYLQSESLEDKSLLEIEISVVEHVSAQEIHQSEA